MTHYIIELYDEIDHNTIIEYRYAYDEIDAVLQVMGAPERFHGITLDDIRACHSEKNIRFIDCKLDAFLNKIIEEEKTASPAVFGGINEIRKSTQRSNKKKPKKTGRKSSHKRHR